MSSAGRDGRPVPGRDAGSDQEERLLPPRGDRRAQVGCQPPRQAPRDRPPRYAQGPRSRPPLSTLLLLLMLMLMVVGRVVVVMVGRR